MFLSSVLTAFVDDLFPGMKVKGAYQFRVTRNSELFVDEEEVENLASALKNELLSRGFRPAVRLEIADNCPKSIVKHPAAELRAQRRTPSIASTVRSTSAASSRSTTAATCRS